MLAFLTANKGYSRAFLLVFDHLSHSLALPKRKSIKHQANRNEQRIAMDTFLLSLRKEQDCGATVDIISDTAKLSAKQYRLQRMKHDHRDGRPDLDRWDSCGSLDESSNAMPRFPGRKRPKKISSVEDPPKAPRRKTPSTFIRDAPKVQSKRGFFPTAEQLLLQSIRMFRAGSWGRSTNHSGPDGLSARY